RDQGSFADQPPGASGGAGAAARPCARAGRGDHRLDPRDPRMTAGAVFDRLTGQDLVVARLRAAVSSDPGTHAWLFTAPPGAGRSVAGRAFAAALLCPEQGCGQCPSCHQVSAGTHPDLLLVRPAGLSYGVKQTRDLVLKAAASPVYGGWRVIEFEDADRATEQ